MLCWNQFLVLNHRLIHFIAYLIDMNKIYINSRIGISALFAILCAQNQVLMTQIYWIIHILQNVTVNYVPIVTIYKIENIESEKYITDISHTKKSIVYNSQRRRNLLSPTSHDTCASKELCSFFSPCLGDKMKC